MNNSNANLQRALASLQTGNLTQAIAIAGDILKSAPRNFDALHIRALALFHAKELASALRDIEAALSIRRDFADAFNTYGIILRAHRRYDDAIVALRSGLKIRPAFKEALYNIGNCHRDKSLFDDAIRSYDEALRLDGNFIAALNNKGIALGMLGQHRAALQCFDTVIARAPRFAEAHYNRGDALAALNEHAAAIANYDAALKLNPFFPACHCNRANALRALDRPAEALSGYDQAIAQDPAFAEAQVSKAAVLHEMGRLDEAMSCLDAALRIRPDYAEAHFNLGNALRDLYRLGEALAHYDAAIRCRPDHAEAYRNRGNLLNTLKRMDEALASYDRAIELKPDFAEAYSNRGDALHKINRLDEALGDWRRSLLVTAGGRASAERVAEQCVKLLSVDNLPAIYASESEMAAARQRVEETLDELVSMSEHPPRGERDAQVAQQALYGLTGFYLAYHQRNDRETMRKLSAVAARLLPERPREDGIPSPHNGRIRIGVASAYLRNHNGANWAYNWLARLPRGDYEVFTYGFEAATDALARKFAALGTHRQFVWSARTQHAITQQMRGDGLDILMLPDVGMTSVSRFLSLNRIAPCQFTAWGHPVTTGSSEMDFYLSSDLMEPENAQDHYTEKLVRLPNLALYLEEADIAPKSASASDFGLPEGRVHYGCLQSLFKYLPRHDHVLPRIAREVPEALFVFIEGSHPHMTALMQSRLEKAFAAEGLDSCKHVVFLPRQTTEGFDRLMQSMDVCIDSIGWSGGNTSLGCIAAGVPLATLPGEFMRGRHTTAMFRLIGAEELIATSAEAYTGLLVKLGLDVSYRRHCRDMFLANRGRLCRDDTFIAALDGFLKGSRSAAPS